MALKFLNVAAGWLLLLRAFFTIRSAKAAEKMFSGIDHSDLDFLRQATRSQHPAL